MAGETQPTEKLSNQQGSVGQGGKHPGGRPPKFESVLQLQQGSVGQGGKHPGGRPPKFESVLQLQVLIDAYFASCDPHMEDVTEWVQARDKKGQLKKDAHGLNYLVEIKHKIMTDQKPYTITGLALALDTTRETLLDYEDKDEFSDTIKKAKIRCQQYAEQHLFTNSPTGAIFNLKNNYGWQDASEVKHSGKIDRGMSEEELDAIINRGPADQAGSSSQA